MDDALRVREADGVRKSQEKTAKNLLNKGMDVSTIAEVTGLSVDDILRL
jgi:MoaA/NifB/PqqE/SkfB family radical SAM enzyme